MVLQSMINGEIYEFASVYASQTSALRARMWDALAKYPWLSNAFICGDFNNSPQPKDNTSHKSHMLPSEKQSWEDMLSSLHARDLWISTHDTIPGYTFHHNALYEYWARLDRWYLMNACQFDGFICHLTVDHSLRLSDHAPLWLTLRFGMPCDDLNPRSSRLLHVKSAYLLHQHFQHMIRAAIHPLFSHAQEDINFAWESFVCRIQAAIKDYGVWYMAEW